MGRVNVSGTLVVVRRSLIALVISAAFAAACGETHHKPPATNAPLPSQNAPAATAAQPPAPGKAPFTQTGMASWYGPGFAGRPTASGEKFDPNDMTCAHPKLKFGTRVRVTNLDNGKSVVVRVNDRGPFAKGRVIDLSKEAAKRLDFIDKGVARVKVEVVSPAVANK
jgi:rare lipoprotein A